MKIDLCDEWESKYKPCQAIVYSTSNRDRVLIGVTFEELHSQRKLKWTTRPTPFSFPVFCFWNIVTGKNGQKTRKGRVVIGIRPLNQIVIHDAIVELLDVLRQPALPREVAEPVYPVGPANDGKHKPAVIEAIDAIKFALMFMKRHYDKKYEPVFFEVCDFVSLGLPRGYNIPGLSERNTKIEQHFSGSFRIIEKIGRLAYRLELPPAMKLHPVISVAHLEPAPTPAADPLERPVAQSLLLNPDFVPDKILRMHTLQRHKGGHMIEFLIRFRGRTAKWDQWLQTGP